MGGFGPTFLPPTVGLGTLAQKFGRGLDAVGNTVGGLATKVADAGRAVINGPGVDPTPDNDPSKSAVQVKAPSVRADIKSAAGYLAPNAPASSFGSLKEKYSGGRGVTPAIAEGAYQDRGGFGEFGSTSPRSLAQTLQDREAQGLLDQTYGAEMAANKAAAPDYQGDAAKAKARDAEYMANSEAPQSLYAKFNAQGELTQPGSFYQSGNGTFMNSPGGPTLKQQYQMQQDRLKNAGGVLDLNRNDIVGQLEGLKATYAQEVKAGRRTQQDADASYQRAVSKAQELAGMLKSGFPPANDFSSMQSGAPTINKP